MVIFLREEGVLLLLVCAAGVRDDINNHSTTERIPKRALLLWEVKAEPEALQATLHLKEDTNE